MPISPSEVPQYIDYVKRDLPTLPLPNQRELVSGTVTQVAGPVAKEAAGRRSDLRLQELGTAARRTGEPVNSAGTKS